MTIKEFFLGCPRNIKRRLLRDILTVLLLTSMVIVASGVYLGRTTRQDISAAIISDTTTIARKRFRQFIAPMETTLRIGRQWGESGLLADRTDDDLLRLFGPFLQVYPYLAAIILTDSQGQEFFLRRQGGQWQSRRFVPSVNPGQGLAHWRQWLDVTHPGQAWNEDLSYDPRTRPWFLGARANPGRIFWTEPYMFFAAQKMGVTVAISWPGAAGRDYVLALDLLEDDLLNFLDSLAVGQRGHIVLLTQDGSIIAHNQAANVNYNKEPMNRALALWRIREDKADHTLGFRVNGQQWWAGFSRLEEEKLSAWVGVIIPEQEIIARVKQRWLSWGLVAAGVLGVGILLVFRLVAKYSYQLRDLPRQNIRNDNMASEVQNLIAAGESATLEFKSTMRMNLKSGKKGKEIELAWLKAVVAFMNSDGGILLIGVEDDGTICGLEADNFANDDRLRLHFKSLVSHHIGPEFAKFLHLKVVPLTEKVVAVIECERVRKPVFLRVGKNEDFFVRSGPSSMKLSMSQMISYLEDRI